MVKNHRLPLKICAFPPIIPDNGCYYYGMPEDMKDVPDYIRKFRASVAQALRARSVFDEVHEQYVSMIYKHTESYNSITTRQCHWGFHKNKFDYTPDTNRLALCCFKTLTDPMMVLRGQEAGLIKTFSQDEMACLTVKNNLAASEEDYFHFTLNVDEMALLKYKNQKLQSRVAALEKELCRLRA